MQGRVQELEHEINRALVTRNRALNWRRKRQDTWENQFLSNKTFLAWKSSFVQAELRKMAQSNENARARLQLVKQEVLKRCSKAKEGLNSIRQVCAEERTRIQSLRDEICQTELPKVLALLENQQREFDTQRECLESQLKTQRECIDRQQERMEMSSQDAEHRVQKMIEAYQIQLTHRKRQLRAISQLCTLKRHRESQHRTFNAWKDFYLRSVVGQATHTAMVFKSQQSTFDVCSPSDRQQSTMPAAIQPVPVPLEPLPIANLNFDDCLRFSVSEAATPTDTMWRKWRRIDTGVAGRGHKLRPSLNSPSQ